MFSKVEMHIASSAGDNYVQHFAAMVHSAWLYNRNAKFYLLDSGVSKENIDLLKSFADDLSIELSVFPVSDRLRQLGPIVASDPTYARIFFPEFIKARRVLYLDSDITVVGDLSDLYSTELNGFSFAARQDESDCYIYEGEVVGAPFTYENYFNAGVMLIDAPTWRKNKVTERVLKFVQEFDQVIPNRDQTVLNLVTLADYQKIARKWNNFRNPEIIGEPTTAILHYVFDKVWANPYSPFFELYKFHRNATPWPMTDLPKLTFSPSRLFRYKIGAALGNRRMRHALEIFCEPIRKVFVDPALERARQLLDES